MVFCATRSKRAPRTACEVLAVGPGKMMEGNLIPMPCKVLGLFFSSSADASLIEVFVGTSRTHS